MDTLVLAAALAVSVVTGVLPASAAARIPYFPVLVDIRAGHHPGFDRVVFDFDGRLPEWTSAQWVRRVTYDPSDQPVPIQGNAFILVTMYFVRAYHEQEPYGRTYGPASRAFDLPNVTQVVAAGDFEAVVSFGIGLMKGTRILGTHRLHDPSRFVIDISTRFPKDWLSIFLVDEDAVESGTAPYIHSALRQVPTDHPGTSIIKRLFAGPTQSERQAGLRFKASAASGFRFLDINSHGVAHLTLKGGCDSHGSEITVANEIMPTLRQLPSVDWVKIHSPAGITQHPWGPRDSIPLCLEP